MGAYGNEDELFIVKFRMQDHCLVYAKWFYQSKLSLWTPFCRMRSARKGAEMGFNYALEKKRFDEEHDRMYQEYIAAGMSEEDFLKIYEYDWAVFKSERVYATHNQSYTQRDFREAEDYEGDCKNPLIYKFGEAFTSDDRYCINDFIEWDNPIDQKQVVKVIKLLTEKQRRILELYSVEGMSLVEIAENEGITKQTVFRQMERIKKKFKKVFIQ